MTAMNIDAEYDAVVVGGGPAGATAAQTLAERGHKVMLLDRCDRIKPCGGAIPPRLIRDFAIPDEQIEAKVTQARMIAPSNNAVDMEIGGFVGMVDREFFDEWLRERARKAGAERALGRFQQLSHDPADGKPVICYQPGKASERSKDHVLNIKANVVVGADGATSVIAKQCVPGADKIPHVFAYHEIVKAPPAGTPGFEPHRCSVYYQGEMSPDFYGWVFPHGDKVSVGTGSAVKGFSLRQACTRMRDLSGMDGCETVRTEGAPLPLKPMKRWDNGRDVILAGDAAGVVAPSSGEGIYYAMVSGQYSGEAASEFLQTGKASALQRAHKRFRREHGKVFFILGIMQRFWYTSDKRRERFVKICEDKDVQHLTWEAYMNKKLVRAKPLAHVRIFFKDMAYLLGLAR